MKNKSGWVRIFEAFISLVFIISVMFTISFSENLDEHNFANKIQEKQRDILHLIQKNDSLRKDILNIPTIPIESNETSFPQNLINITNNNTPKNLECSLKICNSKSICELNSYPEKPEIYVQDVIISSSLNQYNPRKLVIFCWEE